MNKQKYKLIPVNSDYPNPYWIAPNGQSYAYLHRVIAEKKIGRFLECNEIVHHIDRNPLNNDPSNLYVCKNAAEHRLIHKHGMAILHSPELALF